MDPLSAPPATTRMSSKGQIIIPKPLRTMHRWTAGTELEVIDVGEGLLLRPRTRFPATCLEDVAGCLPHSGPALTDDDIAAALAAGVQEQWLDRR
ncbi:MAG: AbrB/MazE/SpoVT family DNA-binding domain-containing protein [Burkholderiales bacterium]|mgnify:FL=1|jgi:AbrB family looped-hinge helix DNA binding protein|nr:AbrB/MazE/SpoVT family DNA-binding domain-containing protein [Burkholderiales bacterium]MBP6250810.1 AbrB/MazE/SpoVT family DNA-binding domain-containing protein [Leptothrix sp. (in: b-proteobacteria)]MBP7521825.1 AbrB/MazE/SpoVT family DNA-binding domain-containing protein [Leptothrix sp. (in: b-proteobacteria)]